MVKIQRQNAFEDVKGKKIAISSYYHKYVNIGNSLLKCLVKFLKKTLNNIHYKNPIYKFPFKFPIFLFQITL